jgi:hypothetical protein
MTTPTTMDSAVPSATPSAVVWIDPASAVVASVEGDGQTSTCDIARGSLHESRYLEQVIRAIGDRRRVMILGPDAARLALEREYVAVFHRPERLVDVEHAHLVSRDELLDLARKLAR